MSRIYDYDKDDFSMDLITPVPEEEASAQEVRHAMFDWAAGGADDLADAPAEPAWGPVETGAAGVPAPDLAAVFSAGFAAAAAQGDGLGPDEAAADSGWVTVEPAGWPAPAPAQPQPQPEPRPEPQPAPESQPAPVQAMYPAAGRAPNGRVVLISGGDRGIGAAAARAFWAEGYRTAILYHTNAEAARALINSLGSDCVAVRCDVADRAACEAAWKVVQRTLGDPDVLVCNAGVAQQKLFTDITEADWQRMIGVDLTGVFHLCQLALPAMIRKKWGRILTVSSMWGQTGGSCEVHYSAAKAGVIGLTKALAKEEGPSGITVNCVAPGVIETDMMAAFAPEDKAALADETPVGRLGTPEEIAHTLTFLAGEGAGFITGQVLGVNGGLVI